MKALVVVGESKTEIRDVPIPEYGADDVLIRVKACAICGSDVHGYDGSSGRRQAPIIMGHEASGIIEKVGANVTKYKPGDRVTFDSTEYCGECYYCKKGMVNLCTDRRVLGVHCDEYSRDGAMAEYISVPQRILYKIPDEVTYEEAAMVEPLSIAVHAYNMSPVKLGDTVVVVGTGTIGLMIISTLTAVGCSQIIAMDIDDDKLAFAKSIGATACINTREPGAPEKVKALTEGRGADVAFEAVGIQTTFDTAVQSVRLGGGVVLVGNVSRNTTFNLQKMVTSQIAMYTTCASAGEYDVCLNMIASGKVDVKKLISETAPLEDGDKCLARLHAAEKGLIKIVLNP